MTNESRFDERSWLERRLGSAITATERRQERGHLRLIDNDFEKRGMFRSGGRIGKRETARAEWAAFRLRQRATGAFTVVAAVAAAVAIVNDRLTVSAITAVLSVLSGAANRFGSADRPRTG